jgi:hypothetical protein
MCNYGAACRLFGEKTHQLCLLQVLRQTRQDEFVAKSMAVELEVWTLSVSLSAACSGQVQREAAEDRAV